jgi:hypothetical protein
MYLLRKKAPLSGQPRKEPRLDTHHVEHLICAIGGYFESAVLCHQLGTALSGPGDNDGGIDGGAGRRRGLPHSEGQSQQQSERHRGGVRHSAGHTALGRHGRVHRLEFETERFGLQRTISRSRLSTIWQDKAGGKQASRAFGRGDRPVLVLSKPRSTQAGPQPARSSVSARWRALGRQRTKRAKRSSLASRGSNRDNQRERTGTPDDGGLLRGDAHPSHLAPQPTAAWGASQAHAAMHLR